MKMSNIINTHSANESHHMTRMTPTTEVVPSNKVSLSPINSMVTTQHVLDNTQTHQVSESTPPKQTCVTPSGGHYTVLGLPILYLSLSLKDPPWTQLIQLGITPIAAELCTTQTFAGRISLFLTNWKALSLDSWVLQTVTRGYHIPLIADPVQKFPPHSPHLPLGDVMILEEEIHSLLQKQAIQQIPSSAEGFYSNMFLVPKKRGGQRPVINLKHLNKFVKSEYFKMEGLHRVKALLQKNDWMAKIDLKDAFFMIPMAPQCHHLLRFRVGKRSYRLPFGLCTAPRVFTKTLKPVVEMLRSMGLRVVIYIDDMLLMASSNNSLTNHIHLTLFLLQNTGFVINEKKSLLEPTQEIGFLGMIINSKEMDISLPGSKIRDIKQEARRLLNHPNPSAQSLSHLIGKLNATTPALQMAPLFCRALQTCLKQALEAGSQDYQSPAQLSTQVKEDLQWWELHLSNWNGRSLISQQSSMTIISDASLQGWGAFCNGVRTRGPWSPQEQTLHINCLELLAASLAVRTFAKERSGITILLKIDNTTAVAYINRMGGQYHLRCCS